jgi:hypothetical protein
MSDRLCFHLALCFLGFFTVSSDGFAQETTIPPSPPEHRFIKEFLCDQRSIWTSPAHIKGHDLKWLAPFMGISAALIATDDHVSKELTYSKTRLSVSHGLSDIGLACMYGAMGALYLDGHLTHQGNRTKTGLLGGEAIADSMVLVQLLKAATNRKGPDVPGSEGRFWSGGKSFPSGHSIAAWSAAAVFANRCPNRLWIKVAAYSSASAIGLARVTGKNHYPSDVVVGAVLGYLIGSHIGKR